MSNVSMHSELNILIIEDNLGDARLVQEHIKEHSTKEQQMTHVETLQLALQELKDKNFDVALLDLGLPDAQDLSALVELVNAHKDLPIVVISGHDDSNMGERAVEQGAQNYITKSELTGPLLARMIPYAIRRKEDQARLKSYLTSGVEKVRRSKTR